MFLLPKTADEYESVSAARGRALLGVLPERPQRLQLQGVAVLEFARGNQVHGPRLVPRLNHDGLCDDGDRLPRVTP